MGRPVPSEAARSICPCPSPASGGWGPRGSKAACVCRKRPGWGGGGEASVTDRTLRKGAPQSPGGLRKRHRSGPHPQSFCFNRSGLRAQEAVFLTSCRGDAELLVRGTHFENRRAHAPFVCNAINLAFCDIHADRVVISRVSFCFEPAVGLLQEAWEDDAGERAADLPRGGLTIGPGRNGEHQAPGAPEGKPE